MVSITKAVKNQDSLSGTKPLRLQGNM